MLEEYFTNKEGKKSFKWSHYFWVYEKHFEKIRFNKLKILEIGVSAGGSLEMWADYFPESTIVGIDIDFECKKHEQIDKNIFVRIGDQSDTKFLDSVLEEFGRFDIVIDDGSHHVNDVKKSFEYLYRKISYDGIYIVEDTHTAYWQKFGGGVSVKDSITNIAKDCIDKIHAKYSKELVTNFFTTYTKCISIYDSIIVFERGRIFNKKPIFSGKNSAEE